MSLEGVSYTLHKYSVVGCNAFEKFEQNHLWCLAPQLEPKAFLAGIFDFCQSISRIYGFPM
jgi:hypothetical protein